MANEYKPWESEGITENEYRKRIYIEARQDVKKLADVIEECRDLANSIIFLPIEHDENGHAFKRIKCRSMDDMGAWVGLVAKRCENILETI